MAGVMARRRAAMLRATGPGIPDKVIILDGRESVYGHYHYDPGDSRLGGAR